MGESEPSGSTLYKTKHTRGSILSYRIGLDAVTTSYLVGWIEWGPSLARSYYLLNTSQEGIPI